MSWLWNEVFEAIWVASDQMGEKISKDQEMMILMIASDVTISFSAAPL